MTKTRKPRTAPFDEDMTQQARTPEPESIDPTDEQLDDVFREFPQHDACLELWRTTEKGGRPVFVDDLMPSEFSFGFVCHEWGGGKYLIKGKYKDGSTIKRTFEIGGDSYPIKRKVPVSPVPNAPPPAQPGNATVEMVRRDDGSYDMAALITGMMNMMKTIMLESRGSKAEWLQELKDMREIFGAQEKPQTPVAEAISMIKTGIELGSTAQGGEGGFPWMMALDKLQGPLTELVSTIKAAITRQPGAVTLPNAGPVPHPVTGPGPGQPAQPTGERPSMDMILQQALRSALPMLVTGAAKGTEDSEAFYCDLLLEQLPRKFYGTAKAFLEKPDAVDLLQKMNPAVEQYRDWFDSLKDALLKALNEELAADASGTIQPEPTPNATADRTTDL